MDKIDILEIKLKGHKDIISKRCSSKSEAKSVIGQYISAKEVVISAKLHKEGNKVINMPISSVSSNEVPESK